MRHILAYLEDEAVSTLEDVAKEECSSPHHFNEVIRHVKHLLREINTFHHQLVAVESQSAALVEGCLIDYNEEEVFDQELCAFPFSKTLQEEVEHAILLHIRLVQYCDDRSLVRHGNSHQSCF